MFKYAADSVKSLWSNFNVKSATLGVIGTLVVLHIAA